MNYLRSNKSKTKLFANLIKITLVITFCFLVAFTCNNKLDIEKLSPKDIITYGDLFGNEKFSQNDSIETIRQAYKYKAVSADTTYWNYENWMKSGKKDTYWFSFLVPLARKNYDSSWYYFLIKNIGYAYKNLNTYEVLTLINTDGIFYGHVIKIERIIDSSKCLVFKTNYYIMVDRVIHSYYPLKKNDIVLLLSKNGNEWGCGGCEDCEVSVSHNVAFNLNERGLFFVDKHTYQSRFMFRKKSIKYLDDIYISNAVEYSFPDKMNSEDYEKKISTIETFFKNEFKKKPY